MANIIQETDFVSNPASYTPIFRSDRTTTNISDNNNVNNDIKNSASIKARIDNEIEILENNVAGFLKINTDNDGDMWVMVVIEKMIVLTELLEAYLKPHEGNFTETRKEIIKDTLGRIKNNSMDIKKDYQNADKVKNDIEDNGNNINKEDNKNDLLLYTIREKFQGIKNVFRKIKDNTDNEKIVSQKTNENNDNVKKNNIDTLKGKNNVNNRKKFSSPIRKDSRYYSNTFCSMHQDLEFFKKLTFFQVRMDSNVETYITTAKDMLMQTTRMVSRMDDKISAENDCFSFPMPPSEKCPSCTIL